MSITQDESIRMKELASELYKKYGITEWLEKSYILSEEERNEALNSIKDGDESKLTELIDLPYPEFVNEYFKDLPYGQSFIIDPTFAYKLYCKPATFVSLMVSAATQGLGESFINKYPYDRRKIIDFLKEKMSDWYSNRKEITAEQIYISQYIDENEAIKLGLANIYPFNTGETLCGFELEEKLDCLNPVARKIMEQVIGLNGYVRTSNIHKIQDSINIKSGSVDNVKKYLMPRFKGTVSSLQFNLGLNPDYDKDAFRLYYNKTYKNWDLTLELYNIKRNILTDEQRNELAGGNGEVIRQRLMETYLGIDKCGHPVKKKSL